MTAQEMIKTGAVFFTLLMVLLTAVAATALESGVFRGRVLDVSGTPVAGAEIFIYRSDDIRRPADFISGGTEHDGAFKITLPVGNYWAVARIREGGIKFGPLVPGDRHSGEPLPIAVTAEAVLDDNFVVTDLRDAALLMRKTDETFYSVQGRILGEGGQPLENAYVYANTSDAITGVPAYLSLWTDTSGRYTLFLPGGEYYFGLSTEFPPVSASSAREIRIDRDMEGLDLAYD